MGRASFVFFIAHPMPRRTSLLTPFWVGDGRKSRRPPLLFLSTFILFGGLHAYQVTPLYFGIVAAILHFLFCVNFAYASCRASYYFLSILYQLRFGLELVPILVRSGSVFNQGWFRVGFLFVSYQFLINSGLNQGWFCINSVIVSY